jgi:O-antigen ligase
LISYEGALQIMAEHPLSGVGLGGFQREFQQQYAPPLLTEHWSIILNDYLTIGMALGVPALLCFACLLWVHWNRASLCHRETSRSPNAPLAQAPVCNGPDSQSLLTLGYRGALIVLLIGFWFDGGLFKLALATPFWVFLELGCSAGRASPICLRGSSEIESPCTFA